ncbi:hypothetical protein BR93DRAFT_958106 [Coniochaeta sp. PMI_546]|nr:hypothetical protein BR93DRAFT_958106 [Coniochaeta sp. PMI_546]
MSPPLPTPTYGQPGTAAYTITCATRIDAPPETCLQVCLDTARYQEWNRYVPRVTVTKQPSGQGEEDSATLRDGTRFVFYVDMEVGRPDFTKPFVAPPKEALRATDELVVTRIGAVDETAERDREVNGVARRVFAQYGMEGEGQRKDRLRVAWAFSGEGGGTWPLWVLRAERVHEFHRVELGDGRTVTDYLCWETFGGLLTPVLRVVVGTKVQNGFDAWMNGMKWAAEEIERRKGAGL